MREELVKIILEKLERDSAAIRADFNKENDIKTRFTAIDDFFPEEIALGIYDAFPPLEEMRLFDTFREKKYTFKALNTCKPILEEATFAFQDERVIEKIAELTGIRDPKGDPHLYAGGISAMAKGHFLNPHLDNSHDFEQKHYRVLNLLYYCTPGWKPENGGNLELWNEDVTERIEIPSLFNRLVLMSTNDKSWHSVNEVKADGARWCVSNYYFSPHSPNGYETKHITYFQGRPEQKVRRLITKVDSDLRSVLRKVVKQGFSKKDLYENSPEESKK